MSTEATFARHAEHAAHTNRSVLGFWVYLMTDCVLFATLFATFAVMRGSTASGPGGAELFDMPFVLVETIILLLSSFTCGLALLAMRRRNRARVLQFLSITFLLGAVFVGMELYEFAHLVHEGYDWTTSGFLSSYFTLVATHGLHIVAGLIWAIVLGVQLLRQGLSGTVTRRLTLFGMFWHFLDVIWIFIFSIVYLWSGRL